MTALNSNPWGIDYCPGNGDILRATHGTLKPTREVFESLIRMNPSQVPAENMSALINTRKNCRTTEPITIIKGNAMKAIRCAIIGLGGIGDTYSKMLLEEKPMDLVGSCDISAKARSNFSSKYPGLSVFDSVDCLLTGLDFEAALILTSDSGHADPFIKCLEAGKHVYVEKPVGNSVREIMGMVKAIDRHPELVASSGHILRYYPINREIKKMALAGEFGNIFYMEGDYIHNLICQADAEKNNEALGKNWYLEDEKAMLLYMEPF